MYYKMDDFNVDYSSDRERPEASETQWCFGSDYMLSHFFCTILVLKYSLRNTSIKISLYDNEGMDRLCDPSGLPKVRLQWFLTYEGF
jgi:hypothetical protein